MKPNKASPLFDEESREQENDRVLEQSHEIAHFYELPEGVDVLDITKRIFDSSLVPEARKQIIRESGRRIILFTYPSDGLKVKGLLSVVPNPAEQPLLIYLRGGNRIFGLTNPGADFMCADSYTVIAPTYRGGVSEGVDEYGGNDVNDIKNLMDFLPHLEKKLKLSFQNGRKYMVGVSRGGMQMFLALSRFPELQLQLTKIVSLSGVLDIREFMATRPDVKGELMKDFGLADDINEPEWLDQRDALLTAPKMCSQLPIIILQGTEDNRVGLTQGQKMIKQLKDNGKHVFYLEIEGGDHCLSNHKDRVRLVLDLLEKEN